MPKPRGICPVCGRSVALRADGRLRDHQGRAHRIVSFTGRKVWAWCPGSDTIGQSPGRWADENRLGADAVKD